MRRESSHLSFLLEMAQIESILVDSSKTDFPLLCILPIIGIIRHITFQVKRFSFLLIEYNFPKSHVQPFTAWND